MKGIGIGLISSVMITFIVTVIVSGSFGGSFEIKGWLWLLQTSVVPLVLCCGISGYCKGFIGSTKLKFWLICASMGFLSVLYMGTIGAIIASGFEFGLENINVIGYLQWGPIYALGFLPVSTMIAAAIQFYFQNRLKQ